MSFIPPASTGHYFTQTVHNDTYDFISPTKANLNGKSVFISGASRGIGKQAALSYATAGASKIALGARSSLASLEPEIAAAAKAAGHPAPTVLAIVLDVTDPKSADAAAATVKKEFGGLDVLINNAGYLEKWIPIAESDPFEWWKTMEVNIKGPYLLTRSFIPVLLGTEGGLKTILNVSSIGAHTVLPGGSSYQTTKMALVRLTEFTQAEYGDKGILALVAHPGGVMTELASNMPDNLKFILADQPALAADTFVWLTKERRDWLAARYVSVTWDMEQLDAKKDEIEKKDLLKIRMAVE